MNILGPLEASGVDLGPIWEQFLSQFGGSVRLWGATLEREPCGAKKVRKIAREQLEFHKLF